MGTLLVVFRQPYIQIGLQLLHRVLELFPEGDVVELVLVGAMEPLADAIGLWAVIAVFSL